MADRFQLFPDAEAVASVALRNAAIAGLGSNVFSGSPKTPPSTYAVVQRLGGIPAERHHLDRARIQVDVWAASKDVAHDVAALCLQKLQDIEGTSVTGPAAYVTGVELAQGLTWAPDPQTDKDRYIFSVYLYLH